MEDKKETLKAMNIRKQSTLRIIKENQVLRGDKRAADTANDMLIEHDAILKDRKDTASRIMDE